MNIKEMGFKLHMFRDNRRECGQKKEWKVNGLQVTWNRPGFAQNAATTACHAVEMLAMSLRACILSGLCSTAEVCVCDIRSMTIPMNHWPVQTLYKTSIFPSDFEDQIGIKKRWQLLPMFALAPLFISAVEPCWSIIGVSLWGLEW